MIPLVTTFYSPPPLKLFLELLPPYGLTLFSSTCVFPHGNESIFLSQFLLCIAPSPSSSSFYLVYPGPSLRHFHFFFLTPPEGWVRRKNPLRLLFSNFSDSVHFFFIRPPFPLLPFGGSSLCPLKVSLCFWFACYRLLPLLKLSSFATFSICSPISSHYSFSLPSPSLLTPRPSCQLSIFGKKFPLFRLISLSFLFLCCPSLLQLLFFSIPPQEKQKYFSPCPKRLTIVFPTPPIDKLVHIRFLSFHLSFVPTDTGSPLSNPGPDLLC